MTPDFDVIIVGSGPAGVSAALPLVESGMKVLMVDGGRQATISPPTKPFLTARAEDAAQWKWMIGEDFHALQNYDAISPKQRVPTQNYVFAGFDTANQIETQNFAAVGSLSTGGLSNTWGCGVARLSVSELSEFPFHASDIERSYETVAKRIGISGCQNDDMSEFFGLDAWAQPPIQMDILHNHMYDKYTRHRACLKRSGFRLGRTRIAALSQDHAGRLACDNSGNCLFGCHRRSLYSAVNELSLLSQYPTFRHETGFVVEEITRDGDCWAVGGQRVMSHEHQSIVGRKVLLAAGTLATTRLALNAMKMTEPVDLLSCPTATFLLWLPRMLGTAKLAAFALGQLSFAVAMSGGITAFGSSFSTGGIPVTEFLRHLPVRRRYAISLLDGLLSSCLVGNVFLPGHLSRTTAALTKDGALLLKGGFGDHVPSLMVEVARRLRKAYWRLGVILLPMSFKVGRPGADIHYAGTLPMRERAQLGETSPWGELHGLSGVHVVDGACIPTLSEKSPTLTIMANADRIGRKIATRSIQ